MAPVSRTHLEMSWKQELDRCRDVAHRLGSRRRWARAGGARVRVNGSPAQRTAQASYAIRAFDLFLRRAAEHLFSARLSIGIRARWLRFGRHAPAITTESMERD